MKVFLDTNVLASGFATRGLCSDVIRTVMEHHDLIICDRLLDELQRILKDRFDLPMDAIVDVLWLMRQDVIHANEIPLHEIAIDDADDIPLLSAAANASADMFVTGDKELLKIDHINSMQIKSPREFWENIRNSPGNHNLS